MLSVWLPGNKDIRNQGLTYSEPEGKFSIIEDNPFGMVMHTTSAGTVNTKVLSTEGWDLSTGSCGFGAWLKFNLTEMRFSSAYTYTSSNNCIHNVVLGFNSYGGISLDLTSNNIYNDGAFNSATLQAHLRYNTTASSAAKTIEFDKWHHWYVQYSKERGKLELYYDGVFTSSANTSSVPVSALTKEFMINNGTVWGGNPPGKYLSYYVSDARVYNNELTADEIKRIVSHKMFGVCGSDVVEGSSVTNYLASANTETTLKWSSYGFGGKGAISLVSDVEPFYPGNVIKIEGNGGTGNYNAEAARTIQVPPISTGEKVTFSYYAKGEGNSVGKNTQAHVYNKSGSTTISTGSYGKLTSEWKRYSHTFTWTGTTLSSPSFNCYIVGNSFTQGDKFYACNFQLENGDGASPYQFAYNIPTCTNDEGGSGIVFENANIKKSGSTVYFNGSSSRITINDISFSKLMNGPYTISFWVNSDEADSSRSVFFGAGNQGNGYTLNIEKMASNNRLRVYNNNSPDWQISQITVPKGVWMHIAITRNGATCKAYKNGSLMATNTSFTTLTSFDKTYYLGADYRTGDTMYKGYIGNFAIYASVFTDAEVLAIYNKEKSRYQ